ncbi:MAG: hypothetical protein IJZ72_02630 [Oscillospiraceae bacterium]|nr:hypothetical protein [Oscillospiraceae bacterium]
MHISYSDNGTDIAEHCREIVDEKQQLEQCIADELHLSYQQRKSIKLPDMLKMLIENFKGKLKEQEEDKSVIASLREQLSAVKEEFRKVAYAVNELVYSDKYKSGLSGWAKALAGSISLFAINCFEKRNEDSELFNCGLDDEIESTAKNLFGTNQTKERNYYER